MPTSKHAPTTRQALPLVVALTLIWGTTWPLFPLAVQEVSVWTFRAISMVLAGGLLLAFARIRGHDLRVPRRDWPYLLAASWVFFVTWNVASTFAASLIPSGQAAILGFTMPLWTALGARLFFKERLSTRLLLAVLLGGVGVGLLIAAGINAYANAPLGFALGLLAAIGWAAGTLITQHHPIPVPSIVNSGWQMLVASVPICIAALALGDGVLFVPSTQTVMVIAYLTLMPMAIGNAVWFSIVGLLPTQVAALSSVMVPVVAMLSGAIVRDEPLGGVQWVAMACCVAGLSLALLPSPHKRVA